MKIKIALILGLSLLVLPFVSIAQTCGPANTIDFGAFLPNQQDNKLQLALTNYSSYPEGDNYALCFIMPQLEISAADDVKSFTLTVGAGETKNIYIVGVNLIKHDDLVSDTPLLTINHSGTGTVYLKNITLSNVKNGLKLEGTGKIEVGSYGDNKTVITGDTTKSGACIDVKSPGAVLSGVQASSCHEGVKVDANNVQIKDGSLIKGNIFGVNILSARIGSKISGSKIYNNEGDDDNDRRLDGIKIDDGAMHELVLYDVINNEPVPILDGDEIVEYNERKAYFLLDLPEGRTGSVEFFYSSDQDCVLDGEHAYKQICGNPAGFTNPASIEPSALANGPLEITIPPQHYGKALVAVYTESERGTAGISRQFELNSGSNGVVAFVANPYDIPTSGGAVDTGSSSSDDEEEQTTGGSGMDGVDTAGAGSSLIDAAGGPSGCGGGASIMALSWRDSSIAGVLWFLIVISAAIASLRLVRVHFKHRQR